MAAFSEIEDGLPLWRLQVEDPQAAQQAPARVHARVLDLPQGAVAAAAVELSDVPGRPAFHHVCGAWEHPDLRIWFGLLRKTGRVRLRFERADWVSDSHRDVELDRATLDALPGGEPVPGQDPDAAVRAYAAFYRDQFPRLKNAEKVWDAYLESLRRPAATTSTRAKWPWILAALGLAAAGAWFVMRNGF